MVVDFSDNAHDGASGYSRQRLWWVGRALFALRGNPAIASSGHVLVEDVDPIRDCHMANYSQLIVFCTRGVAAKDAPRASLAQLDNLFVLRFDGEPDRGLDCRSPGRNFKIHCSRAFG
jgi:hypothetical protein